MPNETERLHRRQFRYGGEVHFGFSDVVEVVREDVQSHVRHISIAIPQVEPLHIGKGGSCDLARIQPDAEEDGCDSAPPVHVRRCTKNELIRQIRDLWE